MLRELALVRESQTVAHRDWQLNRGSHREMRAQRGRDLDWQQNQHQETPSSLSLVMTAESQAQLASHFARLIVRQPA